jgi:hypothetical protein
MTALLLLPGTPLLPCRLPELSAEERKRLLNPDQQVWARPTTALTGRWRGVREESGRLTDGRHFKRFFMLPADSSGGQEKLVGGNTMHQDKSFVGLHTYRYL